jgi:glycosyltransferase involved in cell wall biosynthesis
MIILEHSLFDAHSIGNHLGAPDYSYWFVRRVFQPILERFGIVVPITDPAGEVDRISRTAEAHGEPSVFFSFTPPHGTTIGLKCPTVPVFAWEFDTIPNEVWRDDPRHDWTYLLKQVPAAVTHSEFAASTIRGVLGDSYPIWSIPAPIYRTNVKRLASARGWRSPTELSISGIAIDAGAVDLSLFDVQRARTDGAKALKALRARIEAAGTGPLRFTLSGVVYTAVFNPVDARKNWMDLVAGFIWAFRDTTEATLLLKVTHYDAVLGVLPVLSDLAKLRPFKCRVLVVHGLLPQQEYESLVDVTSYAVNTSTGEGQCLPLMEFMSAGRPAITPLHTAMLDYVTADNSFVVPATLKPTSWPHDPRQAIRCMQHILNFSQLVHCYRESFEVARNRPQQYVAMSAAASAALQRFCSDEVVMGRLQELFRHLGIQKLRPALSRVAT